MSDTNIWDRDEVLRRFCAVGSSAQRHLGYAHAADCFCGNNSMPMAGAFRYDEAVLAFVETAVREAIERGAVSPQKEATP